MVIELYESSDLFLFGIPDVTAKRELSVQAEHVLGAVMALGPHAGCYQEQRKGLGDPGCEHWYSDKWSQWGWISPAGALRTSFILVLLFLTSQETLDRVAQAVWGHLVQAIIRRNDIYIYIDR